MADADSVRRVVRWTEAGAGEPAVVLEAGMNCGAASWRRVIPLLAPQVRVAAYDRAGLGGSAPAPGLATIDRMIDDLTSVITGLAAGPCVLAGHSWGGVLVQLLAFRRPDLVAGLVLVDPGYEEMERLLPLPVRWGWRIMRAVFPDELHDDAHVTLAAMREMRAAAAPVPDVPVVVLSAARGFPRRFRAGWTRLQAGRSRRGSVPVRVPDLQSASHRTFARSTGSIGPRPAELPPRLPAGRRHHLEHARVPRRDPFIQADVDH